MNLLSSLRAPLLGYAHLRSAVFTAESLLIPLVDGLVTRRRPKLPFDEPELFEASRKALVGLLERDIANIVAGVYPVSVLTPESPIRHMLRIPGMLIEGAAISMRRARRKAHEFSEEAREYLDAKPEYYKRNFHFQDSGYLSARSARMYDHQVETLFGGAADSMRRLILPPLRKHFGPGDGRGLTFLEIGAGTGTTTRFVRLAFPKAKIMALDLSDPYLQVARERFKGVPRHDFIEGNAEDLPFQPKLFDAVYSVFLFHELPADARERVMRESMRVLKPGGFIGAVDSLQLGDVPELDAGLKNFPKEFHEPFYRDYTLKPLQALFEKCKAEDIAEDTGFFSKVVFARKPG